MRLTKLFSILFGILLLGAILPGTTLAREPETDVFVGTASSGVGQLSPVDVDPKNMTVRQSDGAVGVGYVYRADGNAFGELPGLFEYVERGYLFFKNPADPTTYLGGQYASGVFKLTPREERNGPISIVDTDPSAYCSGTSSLPLPGDHGSSNAYAAGLNKLGLLPHGGSQISYGYFTFTNNYGTQTGYATPDFRNFSIRLKFDVN